MDNAIEVYDSRPLTANDIKIQVDLIQDVMRKVMKDKEHFGVIPGCGTKPALLKPGAEKLNLTFRMAPDPETETIDLGGGHREYRVKTIMRSIESGRILGAGVGSASTMETKWRFRTGPVEFTGKPVPKEYWDLRNSDPGKALALLGGKGFVTKKNDAGSWEIAVQGERVEHDNPADYYNTCWKMAKKRSLVDAVLTVTAASDIFTQDVEELDENGNAPSTTQTKPPVQPPKEKPPEGAGLPSTVCAVENVEVKSGTKKSGEQWTLYTIHAGGKKYNTFSKSMGELAGKSVAERMLVRITYSETDKGLKAEEIVYDAQIPEDENAQ